MKIYPGFTDTHGYIIHKRLRAAYDHICDAPSILASKTEKQRSAEAFLAFIARHAERHGMSPEQALAYFRLED